MLILRISSLTDSVRHLLPDQDCSIQVSIVHRFVPVPKRLPAGGEGGE